MGATLTVAITLAVMLVAGAITWPLFRYGSTFLPAPSVKPATVRQEVRKHPRLAEVARSRLDPSALTGLALTLAAAVVVVGGVAFALVIVMIRNHVGFADFDLSASRFAAHHASATSTSVLRAFTQLGGAVVLVPLAVVVWGLSARRHGLVTSLLFLTLTVGGQFAVADLVKWIVGRTRPNIDRLTGFSGPSFPSGHATAAATCFAAFALLFSIGRSPRTRATLAAIAVALACGIATTRVFLGVHWLTDVLGGLALGWTWFALCSIAFGGRLLRFGAPGQEAARAADRESALTPAARTPV